MNELRVDIGGSNRGFVIATEETKRLARDLTRSIESYTPENMKGAQMVRDKYGKVFEELKGEEGIGGLIEKVVGGFGEAGEAALQLATGPIGAITGALALAGIGAEKLWDTMRESFTLTRDAATLGVSTSLLQRVDHASAEQGFDEGEGRGRLGKFAQVVGEAAAGDSKQANLFKQMGVDIDGQNMEEILKQVAEDFEKVSDPAERARKAVELFGRGGQSMIPILHELAEGGGLLAALGVNDEQTTSVLGGAWQKIHGFFSRVTDAVKAAGKEYLANEISGLTGYTGGAIAKPGEVKSTKSETDPKKTAEDAAKNARDLTEAQKRYHEELEATADTQIKLALLMQDDVDLKKSLAKAEAAHDEVEALKIKTELLKKEKEISETTKQVKEEYDRAHPKAKAAALEPLRREHVDSLSSAGLFSSAGAASNPILDLSRQQLKHLQTIARNTTRPAQNQYDP